MWRTGTVMWLACRHRLGPGKGFWNKVRPRIHNDRVKVRDGVRVHDDR